MAPTDYSLIIQDEQCSPSGAFLRIVNSITAGNFSFRLKICQEWEAQIAAVGISAV